MASAAAPAKPATILPPRMTRTFCAWDFMTVSPTVTWPSPPIATFPLRRTARMVVTEFAGAGSCGKTSPKASGYYLVATAQRPAVGDALAEVPAAHDGAKQKHDSPGDDRDLRVAPRV